VVPRSVTTVPRRNLESLVCPGHTGFCWVRAGIEVCGRDPL